jgi:hypothetical protein
VEDPPQHHLDHCTRQEGRREEGAVRQVSLWTAHARAD